MGSMTYPTLPDHGATCSPELPALAPVGGMRRPVKVVQPPAFRTARARPGAAFTVLRIPVVSLNRPSAGAGWRGGDGAATLAPTTQEAA
jgi:hypothetical protein